MSWGLDFLRLSSEEQNDTKDSTFEDGVNGECDHDFVKETELLPNVQIQNATFESGHLLIPQLEKVTEYCDKCGVAGYMGDTQNDNKFMTFAGDSTFTGEYTREARRLAFPVGYFVDSDVSLPEALSEPVEAGEAEIIGDKDGNNRILVSQNEGDTDYEVTD